MPPAPAASHAPAARLIGRAGGSAPGPLVAVVGALHGNEPAGVEAARRVAARLEAMRGQMRGDFAAFVGNCAAFARGERFIRRDLNRAWTPDRVAAASAGALAPDGAENTEQAQLGAALGEAMAAARGEVLLIDVHSTSGGGAPFTIVAGSARCRAFAAHIPLTAVGSLIEHLSGTMTGAVADRAPVSLVVEAGQHADPGTADRAEAVIWLALAAAGVIPEAGVPDLAAKRQLLETARGSLPASMEVAHRHAIHAGDAFRMRPGFTHFQPVRTGDVLADDARGEVRAPFDAYVLMPLYQGQGDDGFFLAR